MIRSLIAFPWTWLRTSKDKFYRLRFAFRKFCYRSVSDSPDIVGPGSRSRHSRPSRFLNVWFCFLLFVRMLLFRLNFHARSIPNSAAPHRHRHRRHLHRLRLGGARPGSHAQGFLHSVRPFAGDCRSPGKDRAKRTSDGPSARHHGRHKHFAAAQGRARGSGHNRRF